MGARASRRLSQGTESVTVSAQDIGGGVQSILLSADGTPVEVYTASCNFTFPRPCPLSTGPQTLTLPTSQLADGTHTLTLVATDAAGNQSAIASQQVTAATCQVCPASRVGGCSAPATAPAAGPATVTVPGPGAWTLAVWLTNAVGNSNPENAADATLVVPAENGSTGGSNGASSSGGNMSSGGSGAGSPVYSGSHPSAKPTVRLAEALHGRKLMVIVSGPASGKVLVRYACRYQGKTIARGTKTATLKAGRLTVTFRLTARAAARATTIWVGARLYSGAVATSTLDRKRSLHGKPGHRRTVLGVGQSTAVCAFDWVPVMKVISTANWNPPCGHLRGSRIPFGW
jgi:hypothetical protein